MNPSSGKAAIASVLLWSALAGPSAAQNVAVDVNAQKQSIRGFGGMNHPVWAGDLTAAQRTTAFGNADGQLGLSILRMWVAENQSDWAKEVATAKAAQTAGAIVIATPWNPPASMRTNTNAADALYTINPAKFADYAAHLNSFVAFMKTNGVNLYAISIQNEPDYAKDWTHWTPAHVHDFALNYAGTINTKVISAESFNYTKAYYEPILNDPKALANIDIIGAHLYETNDSVFPHPLYQQKGVPAGKELWMTEHYTESANDADLWPMALDVATEIHNSLAEGQFNAYVWWYIRRKYCPIKENGQISKRGYCLAHFSKFIRPGSVRVEATKSPSANVLTSAYHNPADGTVVLVAVNKGTSAAALNFTVSGVILSSFTKYTTSSSKSLAKDAAAVAATGGTYATTLDAQSVTTFVAKGTASALPRGLSATTQTNPCHVYNPNGMLLGAIDLASGLQAQVAKLAGKPGVYIVRSTDGLQSFRLVLTGAK